MTAEYVPGTDGKPSRWRLTKRHAGPGACPYCSGFGATYSQGGEPHPSPRIHPGALPPRHPWKPRDTGLRVTLVECWCAECFGTGRADEQRRRDEAMTNPGADP